ncbi:hypothetical protein NLG97_g10176 [Lecanicillium saksenae]|uniref:Uncharacterized protein n=1 Tax=Lecanicillium saksenae TaxID=468837 RepID=A0ACC1QDX2_9HYPO|nr:hypothetical protein NLG97_g10176 [Lecanicillium saksenae]
MGLWSETATILPGRAEVQPPTKEQQKQKQPQEQEQEQEQDLQQQEQPAISAISAIGAISAPPPPPPPPQQLGSESERPQLLRRPSNWSIDTDPFDMPSLNGFAAAAADGIVVAAGPEQTNGTHAETNGNGIAHRPKTPTTSAMALTEYSVCPSPPSETAQARIKQIVPDEFLLPDGYPDSCWNLNPPLTDFSSTFA